MCQCRRFSERIKSVKIPLMITNYQLLLQSVEIYFPWRSNVIIPPVWLCFFPFNNTNYCYILIKVGKHN